MRCGMYDSVYRWLEENHLRRWSLSWRFTMTNKGICRNGHQHGGRLSWRKRFGKSRSGGSKSRPEAWNFVNCQRSMKMASVIHHGKLLEVGDTIGALFQWVGENGYEANGAYRELHLFGRRDHLHGRRQRDVAFPQALDSDAGEDCINGERRIIRD